MTPIIVPLRELQRPAVCGVLRGSRGVCKKRGLILRMPWRRPHSLQPHMCDKDTARQVTATVDQAPSEFCNSPEAWVGQSRRGIRFQGSRPSHGGHRCWQRAVLGTTILASKPGPRRLTKEERWTSSCKHVPSTECSSSGSATPPCLRVKQSHDQQSQP